MTAEYKENLRNLVSESLRQMEERAHRQLAAAQQSLRHVQETRALIQGGFDDVDWESATEEEIAKLVSPLQDRLIPRSTRAN